MKNSRFIVSYDIADAWEMWYIELTDEGQETWDRELGEDHSWAEANDWLANNVHLWEYSTIKDSGWSWSENFTLQEEL